MTQALGLFQFPLYYRNFCNIFEHRHGTTKDTFFKNRCNIDENLLSPCPYLNELMQPGLMVHERIQYDRSRLDFGHAPVQYFFPLYIQNMRVRFI